MALRPPLRPPSVLLTFLYPPRCFAISRQGARPFSNGQPRAFPHVPKARLSRGFSPGEKADPATKVAMKEAMKKGGGPTDIGIIPQTFIMPTGANKPSVFSFPRERLQIEWHRVKSVVKGIVSIYLYKSTLPKPRPPLKLFNMSKVAQALHVQVFTAFADGDLVTIQSACASGLANSFTTRLDARPSGNRFRWTLHRYKGRPRVVSHRAILIPEITGLGVRQAVVRIRSEQSLERIAGRAGQGTQKATEGQEEATGHSTAPERVEKTEYVVIQKMITNFKEGPWVLWGTTEEADWRKTLADPMS